MFKDCFFVYSNQDDNSKTFKIWSYYLPKDLCYKDYNLIINGKNYYGKPIDSDIKKHKEIRKLTLWPGEDSCYVIFVQLWIHQIFIKTFSVSDIHQISSKYIKMFVRGCLLDCEY